MNKLLKILIILLYIFIFTNNQVLALCMQDTGSTETCSSLNKTECNAKSGCYWTDITETQTDGISDSGNNSDGSSLSSQKVTFSNPVGKDLDFNQVIGKFINAVLGLVGSIAILLFVYAGFLWMSSQGNSDKIEKAKSILIWNTIGIFIIFSSYAIVRFILVNLG